MADVVRPGDLELIAAPLDVLGVNYYHGSAFTAEPGRDPDPSSPMVAADGVHTVPRGLPLTGMCWEVQPDGLRRLLVRLQREYTGPAGIPIYVTENGAAYDDEPDAAGFVNDEDRRSFFEQHLRALYAAIAEGVDVRGYFAWSLLDNFEWAFGFHQRFGLVRVEYDTQRRIPKASGLWYARVAASNALPG